MAGDNGDEQRHVRSLCVTDVGVSLSVVFISISPLHPPISQIKKAQRCRRDFVALASLGLVRYPRCGGVRRARSNTRCREMTNVEIRMTNEAPMTNVEGA